MMKIKYKLIMDEFRGHNVSKIKDYKAQFFLYNLH